MESKQIAVKDVQVDPGQPRKIYADMEGLTESIKNNGFDPFRSILIKTNTEPDGRKYQTIWGNRRTMAAEKAGVEYLWAYVVDGMSEQEIYEAQLKENEHRADLRPMERALAFKEGLEKGISQNHMAKMLAISVATLKADLDLCGLNQELHKFVDDGKLPKEVARKLATSGKSVDVKDADGNVEMDEKGKPKKMFVLWSPGEQMSVFNECVKGEKKSSAMLAGIEAYIAKQAQQNLFALANKRVADKGGLAEVRRDLGKLEKAGNSFDRKWIGDPNVVNSCKRELEKLKLTMKTLVKIGNRTLSQIQEFEATEKMKTVKVEKAVAVAQ